MLFLIFYFGVSPLLRRLCEFKHYTFFYVNYFFCFSFVVSQMDGDQYVPIWTVANFNQACYCFLLNVNHFHPYIIALWFCTVQFS